ncbi:MAG: DpnII family type II restriction endonuclease [Sphaerochaetaceae bacterium]|nr:DpnII family type II restriction endonuclease [Sphaerochaetaceae bacterium]
MIIKLSFIPSISSKYEMLLFLKTAMTDLLALKQDETARSYKTLAQEVATIDGVTFIWFTDGCGWNSAKNNLEETFDVLDTVYNIQDLEEGILQNLK